RAGRRVHRYGRQSHPERHDKPPPPRPGRRVTPDARLRGAAHAAHEARAGAARGADGGGGGVTTEANPLHTARYTRRRAVLRSLTTIPTSTMLSSTCIETNNRMLQ